MDISKIKEKKEVIAEYNEYSDNKNEREEYINNAVKYGVKEGERIFINATNMDSNGANGVISAEDMNAAARMMLVDNAKCHTLLWKGSEIGTIQGVSFHESCPTGTWFNVMSMSKAREKGLVTD